MNEEKLEKVQLTEKQLDLLKVSKDFYDNLNYEQSQQLLRNIDIPRCKKCNQPLLYMWWNNTNEHDRITKVVKAWCDCENAEFEKRYKANKERFRKNEKDNTRKR